MISEVRMASSAVGIGGYLLPTIVWRKVVYGIGSRDREIPPTEIALAKSVTDWFIGLGFVNPDGAGRGCVAG